MASISLLSRRLALAYGAGAVAATLTSMPATAQSNTVRFILPNATGSGVDAIVRAAQPALSNALGASVVVENLPGAGGVVGLQALARSAPDGHTFAFVSNNVVILPSVLKSVPFDVPGDFTPVALVGAGAMVLVVNPANVPATNGKEFIALLKSKPGALNYASGGNGTILHLAAELFLEGAGATAKHIPYKGVGPMVTDLIGGQVDFGVVALPSVQGQLKTGALRAIGVMTPERNPAAPDIPTLAEQGLANLAAEAWFGILAPKGMTGAQLKRAHDAVVLAFADPAVKEAMARQGNTIRISTSEQAQATFNRERDKFAALVKKLKLEPQ